MVRRIVIAGSIPHKTDSDGNLKVFNVERNDNGSWVNSNYANPDNQWSGNVRLLVRRNCVRFSSLRRGVF